MNDQEAIARLKRGNIDGLSALISRYQVQAVRTAYLITQDVDYARCSPCPRCGAGRLLKCLSIDPSV